MCNLPNTGSILDRGLSFTPDKHILVFVFSLFVCLILLFILSLVFLPWFFHNFSHPPPRQPFRPKSAVREYGVDVRFCAPLIPAEIRFSTSTIYVCYMKRSVFTVQSVCRVCRTWGIAGPGPCMKPGCRTILGRTITLQCASYRSVCRFLHCGNFSYRRPTKTSDSAMEAFIRNKYEKKKFIAKVSYVLHELVGVPFSSMDVFASSIFGTGSLCCRFSVAIFSSILSCLPFHLSEVLLIRISQGFAVKFSPDPDLGF